MISYNWKSDSNFYEILRNSQPLAFLASFAIVIAAFTYQNKDLPNVHVNAVIASIMFFASFILAMADQARRSKDPVSSVTFGKYFFLAIGILYLIFVSVDFAKSIPQITSIVSGWFTIAMGVAFLIPMIKRADEFQKRTNATLLEKSMAIGSTISAFSIIAAGSIIVSHAFFKFDINISFLYIICGLGVIPVFISDLRNRKQNRIKS